MLRSNIYPIGRATGKAEMNTTKLRSEALESFVKCFNVCYPDWEVDGDTSRDLTADHVEYSYTTAYWAKCGPRKNGRVYFALNSSWYEDASPGDRLGLLMHELAHVQHTNHSPAFWEQVVENYHALQTNAAVAEDVILGELAWDTVKEFLVNDPLTNCVDNRSEIAYERRTKIAESIGYPTAEITPFENMRVSALRPRGQHIKRVTLDCLNYDHKNPDEVVDYFHRRSRDYVEKQNGAHVIQPLPARKSETGYELLDGHEMATLADYVGRSYVYVDLSEAPSVVENKSVQSGTAD